MKFVYQTILFTLVLLVLSGCGSGTVFKAAIINEKDRTIEKNRFAYVIAGLEIGEGDLDMVTGSLFLNNNHVGDHGIVFDDDYMGKTEIQAEKGVKFKGDLLRISSPKRAYRVWKIDKEMIPENGAVAIFYISSAGQNGEKNQPLVYAVPYKSPYYFKYRSLNGLPLPIKAPPERRKNQDESWRFLGVRFKIEEYGIYYLGDIKIEGKIIERITHKRFSFLLKKSKNRNLVLGAGQEITADPESVKLYIQNINLAEIPLKDVSAKWKKLDSSDWYSIIFQ